MFNVGKGLAYFEISPGTKDKKKAAEDVVVPVLRLTQFTHNPKVSFDNVKIGTTKEQKLVLLNPKDLPQEVFCEKFPPEESGFHISHKCLTLSPAESFEVTLTWTPPCEGNTRELIHWRTNLGVRSQTVVLGSCIDPKPKKRKDLKRPLKPHNSTQNVPNRRTAALSVKKNTLLVKEKNRSGGFKKPSKKSMETRKPSGRSEAPQLPLGEVEILKTITESQKEWHESISSIHEFDPPMNSTELLAKSVSHELMSMQDPPSFSKSPLGGKVALHMLDVKENLSPSHQQFQVGNYSSAVSSMSHFEEVDIRRQTYIKPQLNLDAGATYTQGFISGAHKNFERDEIVCNSPMRREAFIKGSSNELEASNAIEEFDDSIELESVENVRTTIFIKEDFTQAHRSVVKAKKLESEKNAPGLHKKVCFVPHEGIEDRHMTFNPDEVYNYVSCDHKLPYRSYNEASLKGSSNATVGVPIEPSLLANESASVPTPLKSSSSVENIRASCKNLLDRLNFDDCLSFSPTSDFPDTFAASRKSQSGEVRAPLEKSANDGISKDLPRPNSVDDVCDIIVDSFDYRFSLTGKKSSGSQISEISDGDEMVTAIESPASEYFSAPSTPGYFDETITEHHNQSAHECDKTRDFPTPKIDAKTVDLKDVSRLLREYKEASENERVCRPNVSSFMEETYQANNSLSPNGCKEFGPLNCGEANVSSEAEDQVDHNKVSGGTVVLEESLLLPEELVNLDEKWPDEDATTAKRCNDPTFGGSSEMQHLPPITDKIITPMPLDSPILMKGMLLNKTLNITSISEFTNNLDESRRCSTGIKSEPPRNIVDQRSSVKKGKKLFQHEISMGHSPNLVLSSLELQTSTLCPILEGKEKPEETHFPGSEHPDDSLHVSEEVKVHGIEPFDDSLLNSDPPVGEVHPRVPSTSEASDVVRSSEDVTEAVPKQGLTFIQISPPKPRTTNKNAFKGWKKKVSPRPGVKVSLTSMKRRSRERDSKVLPKVFPPKARPRAPVKDTKTKSTQSKLCPPGKDRKAHTANHPTTKDSALSNDALHSSDSTNLTESSSHSQTSLNTRSLSSNSMLYGSVKDLRNPGIRKRRPPPLAQSRLTLYKAPKTKTVSHPNPYAAKNIYYDDRWAEKEMTAFTKWLNFILTPPEEESTAPLKKADITKLWMEANRCSSMQRAASRESMSLRAYTAKRRLNRLRRSACIFYQSPQMAEVVTKLEIAIERGQISMRKDRQTHADIGLKQEMVKLALCYNPLWLRVGLETVYGEVILLNSTNDVAGLTYFLINRLVSCPDIAERYAHPTVPHMYRQGYEESLKVFQLKKLLVLVYFLDQAKESRLIDHDPCLFNKDSEYKSSRDILLAFARDFLSGIGDITKHLGYLGYVVSHKQTLLDEFDYAVTNLAVDLRCGVRLTRVAEILSQDFSHSKQLRMPAVSRLQKVHNTTVSLGVFEKSGMAGLREKIPPKDIVDGHREKTLELLWQIIYNLQIKNVLSAGRLRDEIKHLQKSLQVKACVDATLQTKVKKMEDDVIDKVLKGLGVSYSTEEILELLKLWVQLVCAHFELEVDNFTVSFCDGRAFCYLLHFYHPELLLKDDINMETTLTMEKQGINLDMSLDDSFSDTTCIDNRETIATRLANEKANFNLFLTKVKELGAIPILIAPTDMINTIPDEKVTITFLTYLCARLLDLSEEIKAARILQVAWRRKLAAIRRKKWEVKYSFGVLH